MELEKNIIGHINMEMIISFFLAMIGLFLFRAILVKETKKNGYGAGRFMTPTLLNIAFHVVTSFLFLWLLHEISEVLINNFIPKFVGNNTFSGVFGGYAFAWVFEKGRKRLNVKDKNITHNHNKTCNND